MLLRTMLILHWDTKKYIDFEEENAINEEGIQYNKHKGQIYLS